MVVTNTLGLQRAGIAHDSQDPPGGEFVRDGAGRLTGMLLERPAFSRLTRLLPQPSEEDRGQGAGFNRGGDSILPSGDTRGKGDQDLADVAG